MFKNNSIRLHDLKADGASLRRKKFYIYLTTTSFISAMSD